MYLTHKDLSLRPFTPLDAAQVGRWFYDPKYHALFRGMSRVLSKPELENYPALINGEVLMVIYEGEPVGMVEAVPDYKRNLGFYFGILIDEKYQDKPLVGNCLILFFDYMFNRRGFRKAKIDILSDNEVLRGALEGTGFTYEGFGTDECFIDGSYKSELKYCMFADYFNERWKDKLRG